MESKVELDALKCGDCGSSTWKIFIGREGERTFLITVCAKKECLENRREELGATSPSELVTWCEFDITGQGFDDYGIVSPLETN